MLFDPFIEKLNLPTFSVEFGNGKRIKRRVVGNEPVNNTGSIVFICYHSEGLWVMLSRFITGMYILIEKYTTFSLKSIPLIMLNQLLWERKSNTKTDDKYGYETGDYKAVFS
jgi:hypothetical protein